MAINPFADGYHAGLVNDRDNPHLTFTSSWFAWRLGNDYGVRIHCAVVEAVYIRNMEEE